MRPRSHPSRGQRVARAALATAVLGVAALAPTGPSAGQEPAPTSEVRFTGVGTTPWVAQDGTWTLDLRVTGAPADGEVRAVIRDELPDREAYHAALFGVVEGERKAAIPAVPLATAPDADTGGKLVSLAVSLQGGEPDQPGRKVLADGLRPGVYPVQIEVVDGAGETRSGTIAFLTRVPSGEETGADDPPLLVAPVIGLSAPPSIAPDGEAGVPTELLAQAAALTEGRDVAEDLLGRPLPVTLAPRPESIEALARDEAGRVVVGDLYDGTTTSRQVLDAPYVEVPLSSWVEADLDDELTAQRVRGNTVLSAQLGPVDSSTFLATSGLTPGAAFELWDVGVRTVIDAARLDRTAPTGTPFTVPAGDGRTLTVATADSSLTAAMTVRGDAVLDQAGLAAELTFLAAESDATEGVVLMTPSGWPRRPQDLIGLAGTLLAPEAPIRAATVADLVASVPTGPGRDLPGVLLEDLGDQPTLLRQARARLRSYASLTGTDDPTVASLDQRLLLSGSTALPPETRRRYTEVVLDTVDQGLGGVEAPPRQTITLTSSDGSIPLTLRSRFRRPVQVVVEMDAGTRIQFREGTRKLVTLTPGINRVPVPVHARAPGETAVDITLRTPDGAEVLDEVQYTVRSTAIPGIGLVLSIGAALFLVLWWFRHWRATRRARMAAT